MFNIKPIKPHSEYVAPPGVTGGPTVDELRDASVRYGKRTDSFAAGKEQTCLDMARSLARDGHFRSVKQHDFARKLVEWSKPRATSASQFLVPSLFAVMQRLADVTLPTLKISRKNQDTLCWIIGGDTCIGRIENGAVTLFTRGMANIGVEASTVLALLRSIEADPIKAIADAGRASGRCAICSRDLTDEGSIARGIGPVCAGKLFA